MKLDLKRQDRAKEYARIKRRLFVVDLLLGAAVIVLFLITGASSGLKELARLLGAGWELAGNSWWLVGVYFLGFALIFGLVDLPLSYYSGFVLPHRYDLSTQTLRDWIADQVKGGLLGLVFGLVAIEVVYALLRAFPETWWLLAAAVWLLFTVLLSNLAPILIYPIFFKFTPLADQDLANRLARLAEHAGVHVRGVFVMDLSRRTRAANAVLMGLGNTRRIVLGDTLIDEFPPDEIETVLAHELGHHVHHDIPLLIASETALTLIGFAFAHLILSQGSRALGFASPSDIAAFPLFAIALGVFGLITMPIGNALTRWRERLADEYAVQATGKPLTFADALTRLANQNLAEAEPEPWVEWLLYSHPAMSKRIAAARAAGG